MLYLSTGTYVNFIVYLLTVLKKSVVQPPHPRLTLDVWLGCPPTLFVKEEENCLRLFFSNFASILFTFLLYLLYQVVPQHPFLSILVHIKLDTPAYDIIHTITLIFFRYQQGPYFYCLQGPYLYCLLQWVMHEK